MRRLGSALKVTVVGITVGAMMVLGAPLAASAAAPSWVDAPNRLYMLPTNGASTAPVGFPTPIPQTELLFDDSEDQISGQLRKLEVESGEVSCDPAAGNNFDFTGCTAIQFRVSHGVLDFTDTPSAVDDPDSPFDVYQLPGGATVRDMSDPSELPAPVIAVIGTTAQVNAAMDTLRYTPDPDYYYTGSNGEELELDLVPGDPMLSIVSIDVQIRVVDYNDAPSLSVPAGVTDVASDQDAIVGLGSEWSVEDEDNDEPIDGEDPPGSGNDPYDGDGREFLLVGWSSCGSFAYQAASGFIADDNITDLLFESIDADPIPTAEQQAVVAEMAANLPASIFGHVFENENPNEFHAAWAGIAGDIEDINYALDEVTFRAQNPADNSPLADTTCQLYTFVSDLGNNGLPGAYTGAPPDGLETPWVAYDASTNSSAGVEKVDVKVGQGTEITASVTGTTVNEGGTSNVTVAISPAEHPAFTLSAATSDGLGAVNGSDYAGFPLGQSVPVPANATSVTIPVNASVDAEFDPAETYFVTLSDPNPGTPPPGYRLTVSAAPATVTIIDPGQDVTSPTASVGQAAGQLDPALFSPILFTIVFSEAVTGFGDELSDLEFTGTAGGALTGTVTGSGDTYQVAVQGMTSSGMVQLSIPTGAAEDSSGNPSEAATPGDNQVMWQQPDPGDVTSPTVTLEQGATQVDPATLTPILFDVHFSEPVNGLEGSDFTVTGTAGATAASVTGSGQDYVVSVSSIPGFGTVLVSLPAGAAEDASGNLSFAATSTDNAVTYEAPDPGDVTPPSVTIDQAAAQTDPTSGASIVFDVVFSEVVTGFDGSDVVLSGTGSAGTTANVLGSGSTYTVIVSGMTVPGTVIASIPAGAAQDAAAIPNASLASTSTDNTVTWQAPPVDVTPPTVTINQGAMQSDPTTFSPVVFDVVFSEPVTGFDAIDVSVTGTANGSGAVVTGSGAVYQVQVTTLPGTGFVVATINPGAAMDAAMNPSLASTSTDNVVFYSEPDPGDITQPTVTLEQAAGQADPTSGSPVEFTVTFSEPVTGFTAADVDLSLSTAAGPLVANLSGGGPIYTVTVTGMSGSGSIIARVPADAALDAASNPSTASFSIDNTVTFNFVADTTDPTVTINQGATQVDPTSASTVVFDVLFSEPVLGFTSADITIGGTALATTALISGAGPAYTVTVSGMTVSGTVTASIAASTVTDGAGNPNEASTSTDNTVTFALDVMAPTVTVEQGAGQGDPTAASPIVFDVLFSEPVTGFTDVDVAFTGSTAGGTLVGAVSGSGTTYTITVTGMTTAGTVVPSLLAGAAVDVGSNPSAASTSTDNTVTWAPIIAPLVVIVPPNVTVVAAQGQSGAFVTFATPTATGGVPPVTVVCDHNSGDFFPIGTTIVTCTATDSAEMSLFAATTATFSVTVTAAPVVPPAVLGNTGLVASPLIALGVLLVGAGALVLMVRRRAAA